MFAMLEQTERDMGSAPPAHGRVALSKIYTGAVGLAPPACGREA